MAVGAVRINARLAKLLAKLGNKGADVAQVAVRGLDEGVDGVAGASRAAGAATEAAEEATQQAATGATRGARNPKVAAAAARGREAHRNYRNAVGGRADVEVTLPSGRRADAVEWETRTVRELKPDNPRAVRRGQRQVEGYRQELEDLTGESWTGVVDVYRP